MRDLIWHGNFRPEDVNAICRARLRDPATRPDAVFCTNGPTALGVLRAFRDCGLQTPRDIAFATFDELTVDDLFSPSITTVVQPAYDIGSRAAQILLDRIEGVATQTRIHHRPPSRHPESPRFLPPHRRPASSKLAAADAKRRWCASKHPTLAFAALEAVSRSSALQFCQRL